MPVLLGAIGCFGLVAVIVGNVLAHAGARSTVESELAFTSASPTASPSALTGPSESRRDRRAAAHHGRAGQRLRALLRPTVAKAVFGVCFVGYATVAGILVFHFGSIAGDAYDRVANAYFVFYSRDPHLAAIGFVWNPLPSLLDMPLFVLRTVFPALTRKAFAGNLCSALFMAGAVVQLRATLRELGVRPVLTWCLVVVFAVNPMIVYYGANGMSEAFYLFFLIASAHYLVRWLQTRAMMPLVISGVLMALCYLVRYEAIAAAAAAGAVVLAVSYWRASGERSDRLQTAGADALVYGFAPAAAFIGWAVISYVITGQPFQTLTSQYGNSAIVAASGGISASQLGLPLPVFGALQLLAYSPLLPVLVGAALWRAWAHRDPRALALLPVGAVLVLSYFTFILGTEFAFLRYYLPGLPLALLSLGVLFSPRPDPSATTHGRASRIGVVVATVTAVALAASTLATTAVAMNDPKLGAQEQGSLGWVLHGRPQNNAQLVQENQFPSAQAIAATFDRHHFRSGSILTDTAGSHCMSVIYLMSDHPHQFVIPPDRDFQRFLADPPTFKVQYLLVPPNSGEGTTDALNRQYPSLYANGAGFATQVMQFHEVGCPPFRLYRVRFSPLGVHRAAA